VRGNMARELAFKEHCPAFCKTKVRGGAFDKDGEGGKIGCLGGKDFRARERPPKVVFKVGAGQRPSLYGQGEG